jgi:hypothetical protein
MDGKKGEVVMASGETLSAEIVDGPNQETLIRDGGKRGGVFFRIKTDDKFQKIYVRSWKAHSRDNGVWDLWGTCLLAPGKIWFPFRKLEYNVQQKKGTIIISSEIVEIHNQCKHFVYKSQGIDPCMVCGVKEGALQR